MLAFSFCKSSMTSCAFGSKVARTLWPVLEPAVVEADVEAGTAAVALDVVVAADTEARGSRGRNGGPVQAGFEDQQPLR